MNLWTLVGSLVLLAGLIAYVGDVVGRRVGRRHLRLFGLRPRTTALVFAILTGMIIALVAFFAFFFLAEDARRTILEAEQVRLERDRLREEVTRLSGEVQSYEGRVAQLFAERERLFQERDRLEANLNFAEFQLQEARRELEKLQAERDLLLEQVRSVREALAQREEELRKVEAERDAAEAEFLKLQAAQNQLLQELEELREAQSTVLSSADETRRRLEARLQAIREEIARLEEDRRRLRGDLNALLSEQYRLERSRRQLEEENARLAAQLEAAQLEERRLNASLARLKAEQARLEQGIEVLRQGLSRVLKDTVLAEVPLGEGRSSEQAWAEVVRKADVEARVAGFRGVLLPGEEQIDGWTGPGVLQARAQGITPEGKLVVGVRFVPTERRFVLGQVISMRELPPPRYQPERVREGLIALRKDAEERLLQAGILPERVAEGRLTLGDLARFQSSLADLTGNVVVGVVALEDLFTTGPVRVALQVLYVP
ncbi:DUF3084 domain-containing protein [Marinithermus hydrothermalis]|uniref:DUF3084 domain-containing protein n=1 Tax=Marinithermus hydrothermalis (strain DSM 14884 / JCM 11576 / T1) TaxID=869210 RepID=F2NPB6_MARHT|nr:DUF3084 domain-containing protein [Marinithermus hydrothermalis]AEB12197.1 hypothetical protein Marky_1462 [Marinithermus hydrothermalis DSM 14884]